MPSLRSHGPHVLPTGAAVLMIYVGARGQRETVLMRWRSPAVFVSNQGVVIAWYEQSLCWQSKKKIIPLRHVVAYPGMTRQNESRVKPSCVHLVASQWTSTVSHQALLNLHPPPPKTTFLRLVPLLLSPCVLHADLPLSFSILIATSRLHDLIINCLFPPEFHFLCFKLFFFRLSRKTQMILALSNNICTYFSFWWPGWMDRSICLSVYPEQLAHLSDRRKGWEISE